MRKENRLGLEAANFVFSPLAPELRTPGCSLHRAVFATEVGCEVFAFFREDPGHAERLAEAKPFTLIAHSGIAGTPLGAVCFIVWQIAAGTPQETFVEQYLNPAEPGALKLVLDAASQTHFKFVAINRQTSQVTVLVEFENVFGFGDLYVSMLSDPKDQLCTQFRRATEHVKQAYSVSDLTTLSALP